MEIRKIFYTLECVWVHMKIWSNWKSISVYRKLNPLDSEFGLHSNFTLNQFPLSSLTHTKPKERERERERERACATANPPSPLPPSTRHCLLSLIHLYCCLHSLICHFLLSSLFHLFLFSSFLFLSLPVRPTEVESWIACHQSITRRLPTSSLPTHAIATSTILLTSLDLFF